MTRSRMYQHAPHALLLASAVVGLSLTANTTQPIHAPIQAVQTDVQTEKAMDYDRPYMDAQGDTRSIGDIIRQVRARMDRIDQTQAKTDENQPNASTPLSAITAETPHRRMVRRQDVQPLPTVAKSSNRQTAHFVEAVGPFVSQAPDALAAREYTVLGFGEVGQEQPTTPTANTHATDAPINATDSTGVFAAATGSTQSDGGTAFPAAVLPVETATTPLPSVSIDTPTASVSALPTHSLSTTSRVQALTASPITRTEPEAIAPQRAAEPTPQADSRTDSATPSAKDYFTHKNLSANDAHTAKHQPQSANPFDRIGQTVKATTPANTNKTTKTTKHDTPTITGLRSDDQPKYTAYPTAPKALASAKTGHDKLANNNDAQPSPAPKKTTGKSTDPLLVYVDGHDKIGSDRVKAIDSAVSRINTAVKKADLDVELKITTDKRSDYNIHFAEHDGQGMGNKLGLAEFAVTQDNQGNEFFLGENSGNQGGKAKVSINNAFNWFAGDDDNAIADDQYDYQTAVAHEFLHLLGLDDDFDNPAAVSHGLLSPGTTRRDLDDHDIFGLTDIFSRYNPWQSSYNPSSWASSFNSGWGKTRYKAKPLTAVVPEPATLGLIGLGTLGIVQRRKR